LSPRAACRLATLGFEHVYDYVPGKADWLAHALATEGEDADRPRVGTLARNDVVICRLEDPVGQVRERVQASPYGFALVTASDGTILGRLHGSACEGEPAATAESVTEPGPSTVRPDTAVKELRERLDKKGFRTAIVTTPEGRLIGVVLREALD
jgi:CBS domain-containing protein